MLTVEHRRNHTLTIAGSFFLATVLYHAWLLFYFFPRIQLGKYVDAARLYQEGRLAPERLIDFSPLYFYLHLLITNTTAIYWIHIFAVAVSAAMFFLLLVKFFSLPVSVAGAVLFLTDRSINVYAQVFEPEMLLIFFTLLFVFLIYTNTKWSALGAGFAFGFGLLCRPVFFPVAFAIPWVLKSLKREDWKRASVLFVLPVLVCAGAIWIRNAIVLDHFSPYLMNPGTVFFEGNNPNSRGQSSIYPPLVNAAAREFQNIPDAQHEIYRLLARRITKKQLTVSEVNAFWTSKAAAYLKDNPKRSFYLLRLKFFHTFHQYLWHDLANARDNEVRLRQAGIPAFPFAWISALCLAGMVLLRRRWRELILFYLLFLCLVAVMLLFYVSARQHVSLVFLFLFFASATIEFLVQSDLRTVVLAGFAIALIGLLFFVKTDLMREEDHLWEGSERSGRLLSQTVELRRQGKLRAATQYAEMSAAAAPWNLESRRLSGLPVEQNTFVSQAADLLRPNNLSEEFDKAYLMSSSGREQEAKQQLAELIDDRFQPKRDFYQSSDLLFYLSQTQQENRAELLKRALEGSPGDPWVLADLYLVTGDNRYSQLLFRYFDEADAHWFLAQATLRCACNTGEAISSASYITTKLPEYRNGWLYLAAAYSQAGRWNDAAKSYRRAIAMRADPVMYENEILLAFKMLAEQQKEDAFAQYSYGYVLRQFGHFSDALKVQTQALSIDPGNSQIKSEIDSLRKMEVENE